MTRKQKEKAVRKLTYAILYEAYLSAREAVSRAVNSGAINIDSYDENHRMVLPKSIAAAVLEIEVRPLKGIGTSYERQVKKNIKNIKHFI